MLKRGGRWAVIAISLSLGGSLLGRAPLANAQPTPAPWLRADGLQLSHLSDLPSGQLPPYSLNGNRDCLQREIAVRPALGLGQTITATPGCVVETAYGAVASNGWLQRAGSDLFGDLKTPGGSHIYLVPPPRATQSLRIGSGGPDGVPGFVTLNYAQQIKTRLLANGQPEHTAEPDYSWPISDRAGNRLPLDYDSMAFSADGRWLIVSSPLAGLIRADLTGFEVLPFGNKFSYDIGLAPGLQTAISPSGRYAAVASRAYNSFWLYDLGNCQLVPLVITGPVNCPARNLLGEARRLWPGFGYPARLRFLGEGGLEFYADYATGGQLPRVGRFRLLTDGARAASFDYLALGDSFASGEGAYYYKALTDTPNNKCHLSLLSYPYLLGRQLNLSRYESVACSGAKVEDVNTPIENYEGQYQKKTKATNEQADALRRSFITGRVPQASYIKPYGPAAVTISIGGNDIGFDDKIKRCLEPDTCFSSYEDRLEIVRSINTLFYDLAGLYGELKVASGPEARLYAVGYPSVVKPSGNCSLNVRLNQAETVFAGQLVGYVNRIVRGAASRAGIGYANIEDALQGYRLCEGPARQQAVNGITAGNDIIKYNNYTGPLGNESFHPNARGHQLMAAAINQQTDGLSLPNPVANPTLSAPIEDDTIPLLQAPKSGRPVNRLNYDASLANDVMYRGGVWNAVLATPREQLRGLRLFKAVVNSEPIELGVFESEASGRLTINTVLPASLTPGFHTLHVYGPGADDQPLDIYKTVFVAASPDDLDGDGLPNDTDSCPTLPQSGLDEDNDGIDDACDDQIDADNPTRAVTPAPVPAPAPSPAPVPAPVNEAPLTQPPVSPPSNAAPAAPPADLAAAGSSPSPTQPTPTQPTAPVLPPSPTNQPPSPNSDPALPLPDTATAPKPGDAAPAPNPSPAPDAAPAPPASLAPAASALTSAPLSPTIVRPAATPAASSPPPKTASAGAPGHGLVYAQPLYSDLPSPPVQDTDSQAVASLQSPVVPAAVTAPSGQSSLPSSRKVGHHLNWPIIAVAATLVCGGLAAWRHRRRFIKR